MNKSAAPTELTYYNALPFYKGFAPTELFAFSKKLDCFLIAFLRVLKEVVSTISTIPQRGKTFVNKYTPWHKSTIGATHFCRFSKMDKSSVTIINSILDLI